MRRSITVAAIGASLAAAAFSAPAPALEQQAGQSAPDPVAASYAQLLTEANGRVAALAAQLQQANQARATLEGRIGELEKELAAAKPKPDATPAPDAK